MGIKCDGNTHNESLSSNAGKILDLKDHSENITRVKAFRGCPDLLFLGGGRG